MRLINAEELIENIYHKCHFGKIGKEDYDEIVKCIEHTPTAYELHEGIWKVDLDTYECSICGDLEGWDYDYCPNCGAKMNGKILQD